MASKTIIEPSAPTDPAAVAWLAQLLGHEGAPELLKVNDRPALVRVGSGYPSVPRKSSDRRRCSSPACARCKPCSHLKLLSAAEVV